MNRWRAPLLVPAVLLLAGATWRVQYLGNGILPADAAAMARDIVPGDVVEESPVGARRTAVLATDIAINAGGTQRGFAQGSRLAEALLTGKGVRALDPAAVAFCAPAAPRWCIVDDDTDGRADDVVLPDAADAMSVPIAIAPAAYTVRDDVPLPGDSAVRVRYVGLANDTLRFRLEIVEQGRTVAIANGRSAVAVAPTPVTVEIMGGIFTATVSDARTQRIRVAVARAIPPGPYTVDLNAPGLVPALLFGPNAQIRTVERSPAPGASTDAAGRPRPPTRD